MGYRNLRTGQYVFSPQERQKAQLEALDLEKEKWGVARGTASYILDLYKKAFGEGSPSYAMPETMRQRLDLYGPGGEYGAGAKAEIERGGQQAISAGQLGMAQTGMSSGTNVASLKARVIADTAMARKKVEDERLRQLGAALQSAAQAEMQQRALNVQEKTSLLQNMSSLLT